MHQKFIVKEQLNSVCDKLRMIFNQNRLSPRRMFGNHQQLNMMNGNKSMMATLCRQTLFYWKVTCSHVTMVQNILTTLAFPPTMTPLTGCTAKYTFFAHFSLKICKTKEP